MQKRITLRGVKAKELGSALCRRLRLVPDEEIEITITPIRSFVALTGSESKILDR
jgi:hypothetical protein